MKSKPYILTKSQKPTLLPADYQNFNETIEKYIRFVQSANSFISVQNYISKYTFIKKKIILNLHNAHNYKLNKYLFLIYLDSIYFRSD